MNDDIKEILDNFDNAINELPKTNNIVSSFNEIKVEDLREAVKRLKHIPSYDELLKENKAMQIEMTITWKKVDDLKQRIDKAIETIENYFKEYYISNYDENEIERELLSNLLNILNGRSDE